MSRIHPQHRAALAALSMTPLADMQTLPSAKPSFFADFTQLPLPYSFDDTSSPQTTPTADIADPFLAQWERVASMQRHAAKSGSDADISTSIASRQRQTSYSSLTDSDASVSSCASFSDLSDMSTTTSPSTSYEDLALKLQTMSRPQPVPLQRSSSCRYASTESAPAVLTTLGIDKSMGGCGMVRSYSTPVASLAELRKAKEWALSQAEAMSAATNSHERRSATTESIAAPTPRRLGMPVASDLHILPQSSRSSPSALDSSLSKDRPGLGRFRSFEPAVMATLAGRERWWAEDF